jgi:hypothetical protein
MVDNVVGIGYNRPISKSLVNNQNSPSGADKEAKCQTLL